jgi:6-pyruvoyl-tetrahydropterin synthase
MLPTSSIDVTHNAEIAHRLMNLPGKCQNIHGHSLQITLTLFGELNGNGILEGLDFGTIQGAFRSYIDRNYDHHLLLNENDPFAGKFFRISDDEVDNSNVLTLPGLVVFPNDPTTENLAKWIAEWASVVWLVRPISVSIRETNTNGASYTVT